MTVDRPVRKAIITDAGFASRYLPITKTVPKGMLPLGNRPIMHFVVEECSQAGIEEIIIVATPEGKPIYEDYFHNSVIRIKKQLESQGKLDRYESVQQVLDFPKIEVITQDASLPYGNGSPIASAQKFVEGEEAFLILYSDDVVFGEVGDAQVLVESYERNRAVAGIIMAQPISAEVVDKYGIISFRPGTENELQTIIEKPDKGSEPSLLASYGRYLVKPSIFEYLIPNKTGKDGELWTVDAITEVAAAGGKVLVVPTQAEWMTTGDPENYFHAHLQYVQRYEKYGAKLSEWIK
ncbi:MAG: hypothetical protein A2632_00295 [Candidatus Pacebacteria bacterium RIFCSPHIGHO2_01_FULL_46_16]|nr:MAG: hypothetical protein A2632_00295 [Candidatus Pacebacteria bacterium RIFCSPHIGHO2_01_FULL_46_16]OGJ21932.1 MAG: hypothetical protein A3J60_03810 [Candidatus Pacebacteria bacterium RIFCSPHIGHO2_02_FULL_46_9]OGJ38757.1 MAG: hypothetical protein A3A82_03480 [Candidatus Pacebacteria bacterium RIFCSPLOWO2_01_FULL_47_12]